MYYNAPSTPEPRPVTHHYDDPFRATLKALRDRLRGEGELALGDDERLDGARALVTGANRGLGRAIAVGLARRGAQLILPCRADGAEVRADVRRAGAEAELLYVDLADTDSVHRLADALRTRGPLSLLVLNAGVVPNRARATRQGFEIQIGVNYLANVLLVERLRADGTLAQDARVVVVSSESHRSTERVDLAGLGVADDYAIGGVMKRYGYSKLLLTTWAFELDRRTSLTVHTMCPGPVATGIAREAPGWAQPLLDPIMRGFFASPEVGARPVLYLACARSLAGPGRYFHRFEEKPPAPAVLDRALGAQLFDASVALLAARAPHPEGTLR